MGDEREKEGGKAAGLETQRAASNRSEALDILAGAVLRLAASSWRPGLREIAASEADGAALNARRVARSETLLSPPHRASMSGPGGAQKPPAKEDEHG